MILGMVGTLGDKQIEGKKCVYQFTFLIRGVCRIWIGGSYIGASEAVDTMPTFMTTPTDRRALLTT